MRRKLFIGMLVLVGLYLGWNSFVTVDPTVFVYITQFGRHEATYDGDDENDAGLHARLPDPVQSVQRLDRRLQVFDLPGIELLTRDRARNTIDKTLTLDAYVCWKIADKEGVDRFIRKVGTADRARAILGQRVSSQLAAVIGRMSMDDLVSVQPGKVAQTMKDIHAKLLQGQQQRALNEYGIQIVDIRLRRFNYPAQVRDSIFKRIQSERATKAEQYRREGATKSAEILSKATKLERIVKAQAKAQAERLRGSAIAKADQVRNQAHIQDRDFYQFLKKLEDYERILGDSKTILYLSTQREIFDLLLHTKFGNSSKNGDTKRNQKKSEN